MERPSSSASLEYAIKKYGEDALLASSADLGWSGVAAELRVYGRGVSAVTSAHPEVEIAVPIGPSNSLVTRSSGRIVDRAITQRGTVWLCPPGLKDYLLEVSAPMPQVLHIYLPSQQFSADSLGVDFGEAAHTSLHHEQSFQDPLVAEMAFAIALELQTQSSGGRLLAETLAASLAARLVQRRVSSSAERDLVRLSKGGLDRRRLLRVKEYVDANLEGDLAIAQLARVANLSHFHFARAFKAAVGQSPHQYVSAQRLERAKEQLVRGDQSLLDIAIALSFSSQSNFARAFRISTGLTPGQYRRGLTHSQRQSAKSGRRASAAASAKPLHE